MGRSDLTPLCESNRVAGSTKHMFNVSLIIPLLMGLIIYFLASGAAPDMPIRQNIIAMFGLAIIASAILVFPIPYLFKWNWEAKYFGASLFPLASASALGFSPILCIALFGTLSFLLRLTLASVEMVTMVWWCVRMARVCKRIYTSEILKSIYLETDDAVYYLQREDNRILWRKISYFCTPPVGYFILAALLSLMTLPFARFISHFVGVPFMHILLAVGAGPLQLLILGLCTKGWFVYYYYPKKIWRETGKPVYVDISSKPDKYKSTERQI